LKCYFLKFQVVIKQKSSWEFKLDLKLFSVVRKTERDEDLHQIRKLEKVVDFVRQYGRVGTIDNPDEYVTGSLEMGWRVFDKAAVISHAFTLEVLRRRQSWV
jgi:hypothetical protein